jgi:hypothetical protein
MPPTEIRNLGRLPLTQEPAALFIQIASIKHYNHRLYSLILAINHDILVAPLVFRGFDTVIGIATSGRDRPNSADCCSPLGQSIA